MEDRKGKQVLDELEGMSKVEKWLRFLEETPIPRIGEASSQVISALVGEVGELAVETTVVANKVAKMIEETLKAPCKATKTIDKAAKMLVVGERIVPYKLISCLMW